MTTRRYLKDYITNALDREAVDPDGKTNQRFDTKTKVEQDANQNDAFYGTRINDYVSTGEGNDYVRAGRGNDHVASGPGNDVVKLGRGDDKAFGGDGNDFIMGGRGNDWMDGGAGDDIFGAVNGSNLVRTGDGADTILLTYRQTKMEGKPGNASAGDDAYTTVTDFELGADTLHLTGLRAKAALSKLMFDVTKDGTMISDAAGNKIVYLRDVQIDDPQAFMQTSMTFGRFDWTGQQLETLMSGSDAPGELKEDGSVKLVNFKDKSTDYGVFDFGAEGKADEFKFFHGDDGHLSAEAKAVFSGSSLSEAEIADLMHALSDGVDGLTVRNVTEASFTLDVRSDAYGGVTDTILFQGDVVEENLGIFDDLIA